MWDDELAFESFGCKLSQKLPSGQRSEYDCGMVGKRGRCSGPDLAAFGNGRYVLNVASFGGGLHVAGGGEVLREASCVAVVEGIDES